MMSLRFVGALEHHVLQQVRHAGFAIALVARADHIGDVHRDRRLGVIGEQQHLQAVVEAVFGDAFDGGDFGLGEREGGEKGGRYEDPHGDKASIDAVGIVI